MKEQGMLRISICSCRYQTLWTLFRLVELRPRLVLQMHHHNQHIEYVSFILENASFRLTYNVLRVLRKERDLSVLSKTEGWLSGT